MEVMVKGAPAMAPLDEAKLVLIDENDDFAQHYIQYSNIFQLDQAAAFPDGLLVIDFKLHHHFWYGWAQAPPPFCLPPFG